MPDFNYDVVGATSPAEADWPGRFPGYRRFERTVAVGAPWESVAEAVLDWQVKIRSGFEVSRSGTDHVLLARFGPVTVREPVRVVTLVEQPSRAGFAYGTLAGHPVSGEEAFIAHRSPDGRVWFTLRSLTRPAEGAWRLAFPLLLLAQRHYRRRYLRTFA